MSYAAFYHSFIQHPLLLWAAALLGLWIALSRRGLSSSVRWFCLALASLSVLDAWLTSNQVLGIGPLRGAAASFVPLAFVLIGDFRYFLFVESARSDGRITVGRKGLARACAWTLLVPLSAQLVVTAVGSAEPRVLFFVYEVLFVLVSVSVAALYLPSHSDALRWTQSVTLFVLGYYGLWATADAILLGTGADAGFLLRVLPTALYYGGLGPVIALTAPLSLREPSRRHSHQPSD